ncbi:hypothetical protein BST97_07475 [Nonlabens spongiae]|uniref:Uncharacterized protein n=1 Tax=Nonlabens spongiae TaxID=331648 RepID=A0A1W6MJR4_9FLAO|nr:hypothetical protein BST97_07475 [Nonlabens spongiae]
MMEKSSNKNVGIFNKLVIISVISYIIILILSLMDSITETFIGGLLLMVYLISTIIAIFLLSRITYYPQKWTLYVFIVVSGLFGLIMTLSRIKSFQKRKSSSFFNS